MEGQLRPGWGALNGGERGEARQKDGEESRTDGEGVGSGEKLTA